MARRTARQRAASKRNLVKARARRSRKTMKYAAIGLAGAAAAGVVVRDQRRYRTKKRFEGPMFKSVGLDYDYRSYHFDRKMKYKQRAAGMSARPRAAKRAYTASRLVGRSRRRATRSAATMMFGD